MKQTLSFLLRQATKYLSGVSVAAALAFGGITPASAHVCDGPRDQVEQNIVSAFNAKIAELQVAYDEIAGTPPSPVRDALLRELAEAINQVAKRRDAQAAEADAQVVAACNAELGPYQDAMDTLVAVGTLGLSEILPERMFHIEMGEILDGHLFGGGGSIFHEIGLPW